MNTKKNKKVIWIGGTIAVIMFGFCFAMVPLYNILCKATGTNTSVASGQLLTPVEPGLKSAPDLSREITVQFVAVNHNGMPWEFYPRTKIVRVHPGENKKIFFYAKNTTNKTMNVQAIPSMTPTESLGHFHKIECFCFTQQTLKANESKEMPMIFQIDKELPKDIRVITLAYTLFDVTPKNTGKG